MLELIRRHYTWPNICDDIQKFCKSCVICMRLKLQHHRPYGSLQQLPIPERPWNSISMDFIEKLPSSSGFDTILVIVDCLSKQAILIPTHDTITSVKLACLFITHVFSKHGVSSHVTSDCGSEFVSHFFRSLGTAVTPYKCLGKISDIFHHNNKNNQLERRAWPPKDVPLDTQSWT